MDQGVNLWAAAHTLIGIRFCLHGRTTEGLDCVGLVALALQRADVAVAGVPWDYRLRGTDQAEAEACLCKAGLKCISAARRTGDIILLRPAPDQLHLAIIGQSAGGDWHSIHAHAGLRRVVEMPGIPDGIALSRWRVV